jgi:hypothetical protein
MTKKVTLRLKNNHSIELPPATLHYENDYSFSLDFDPSVTTEYTDFSKDDWEAVPAPYELPKGIGAVVEHTVSKTRYIRVNSDAWATNYEATLKIRDIDFQEALKDGLIVTLAEGAVL